MYGKSNTLAPFCIGSNCPGTSGTVPDLWTLSRVPEGFTICPECGPDSYHNIQFMLYLHCSDAAMALQLVQNGSLSPKQATVLCLNHESLHTSTLITNLWAWFVGVGSNMAPGLWAWLVGVALVPEGSQKKLEPMLLTPTTTRMGTY